MPDYHNFFTYEEEKQDSEYDNVYYTNCVMLKDCGRMKKGKKIPLITISYNFLGWKSRKAKGFPNYDEVAVDYGPMNPNT